MDDKYEAPDVPLYSVTPPDTHEIIAVSGATAWAQPTNDRSTPFRTLKYRPLYWDGRAENWMDTGIRVRDRIIAAAAQGRSTLFFVNESGEAYCLRLDPVIELSRPVHLSYFDGLEATILPASQTGCKVGDTDMPRPRIYYMYMSALADGRSCYIQYEDCEKVISHAFVLHFCFGNEPHKITCKPLADKPARRIIPATTSSANELAVYTDEFVDGEYKAVITLYDDVTHPNPKTQRLDTLQLHTLEEVENDSMTGFYCFDTASLGRIYIVTHKNFARICTEHTKYNIEIPYVADMAYSADADILFMITSLSCIIPIRLSTLRHPETDDGVTYVYVHIESCNTAHIKNFMPGSVITQTDDGKYLVCMLNTYSVYLIPHVPGLPELHWVKHEHASAAQPIIPQK